MLKYFLQPLTVLDILAIGSVLIWFLLYLFNKFKAMQIWVFYASHMLFYLSKLVLNKGNFFVPSAIILFFSFIAVIISWVNKNKKTDSATKTRWIYYLLTVVMVVIFCCGFLLIEASSVLMPPPH